MELNPIAALLILPVLIAGALAFLTWNDRFRVHSRLFSVLMISVGFWALFEAMVQAGTTLFIKFLFLKIQFLAVTTVPVFWLLVIMRYTGREKAITTRNIVLLLLVPFFSTLMVATNEMHHLFYSSVTLNLTHSFPQMVLIRGPVFWLNIGYSYILVLVSIFFLIQRLLHEQTIYRYQAVYMLLSLVVVLVINVIYLFDLFPITNLDPSPLSFIAGGIIMAFGIFKYRLLELVPIARGQIFENILDGVVVIDAGERLIDYNRRAAELFDWVNPRIGSPVAELWADRKDVLDSIRSDTLPETKLILHRDGKSSYQHVSSMPVPVRQPGQAGKILIFHDITKLKQAELELTAIYEKEKELRESLEIESRKRIDFSRTLIHELKTPLTPILSSSDLLVSGIKEEPWASIAQNILRGAETLSRRIDELLDLAKGEIGTLQILRKSISLSRLLEDIVSEMAPLGAGRGQSLVLEDCSKLPRVMADEVRVRQIVQNLITNAFKFSGPGDVITVKACLEADNITVSVRDNGIGLTPEEQAKLFQPYERLDADQRRLGGLGLGLALCKNLVELHGGRIWVESEKGKGSTFSFSLPLQ